MFFTPGTQAGHLFAGIFPYLGALRYITTLCHRECLALILVFLSDLATLSQDQINSEMARTEEAFQRILGLTPTFTRPPYGR
jgi:hypothetical protein